MKNKNQVLSQVKQPKIQVSNYEIQKLKIWGTDLQIMYKRAVTRADISGNTITPSTEQKEIYNSIQAITITAALEEINFND